MFRGERKAVLIGLTAEPMVFGRSQQSIVVANSLSVYAAWANSDFYIFKGIF